MTGWWHNILMDSYRYRRQRPIPEGLGSPISPVDVELVARCRSPKRLDSGISFGSLALVYEDQADSELRVESQPDEPIHLELDFVDGVYTKPLDYGTFSCWSAIEELMRDLEKDDIIIEELWDVAEKMRVCGGDWDARVRPGWTIQVHCQDVQAPLQREQSEDDSDSEDTEGEEERWIDNVIDQYQDEWCLPRWRDRVEQEKSTSGNTQEPSWIVLGLGCLSIVFFVVAVIAYTA